MKNKLIVKLFHCFIARTKKNNLAIKQFSNRPGFTLIELLIVIAVLGILAVGVLVAINVTGNLDKANLAKAKTFAASVENDLSIAQVGKWSFDDESSPGKDTSGYGNDGTLTNGPEWKSASDCALGFGRCLSFDGADDYVQMPNNANLAMGTGSFTISVWINPDVVCGPNWTDPVCTIVSTRALDSGNPEDGYYLGIAVSSIFFQIGDGSANNGNLATPFAATKSWHYIVAVRDRTKTPSKFLLYLDGALKEKDDDSLGDVANNNPLRIGSRSIGGLFFDGIIDEVALYKEALTFSQIQQLYVQGVPRHQLASK